MCSLVVASGNCDRSARAAHDSSPQFRSPRKATVTRISFNEAVCEALFASPLQPSDTLTPETVAAAIGSTARRLGAVGCASCVAEEFGNHPDLAAGRMRWIRQLASDLSGSLYVPTAIPDTAASAGTDLLPVRDAA